jgi:chromosome partitioning protein
MKVLTFFNHAGGVGKTSLVRDVGAALAERGRRVLLLDLDPQANLTEWLGAWQAERQASATALPVMGNKDEPLPAPVRIDWSGHGSPYGLDLIPSTLELASLDAQGMIGTKLGRLRRALRRLDYEFVLIDPPPSLGAISHIAIAAADALVVPLPTHSKSLSGLPTVLQKLDEFREDVNPELDIALFIPNQHGHTNTQKTALGEIERIAGAFGPLSSPLYSYDVYKAVQVKQIPLVIAESNHKASLQVRQVTEELLAALGMASA